LLHATTGVISSSPSSIIVAEFNINTDGTFNEFDFIVCGSVLRKLSRLAQRRVMRLLGESLAPCGVLQLVGPDVADAARIAPVFLPLVEGEHVYRHALLERCTQQRHRQPS
jgi:chemotaxis protein methyltransferase CheR